MLLQEKEHVQRFPLRIGEARNMAGFRVRKGGRTLLWAGCACTLEEHEQAGGLEPQQKPPMRCSEITKKNTEIPKGEAVEANARSKQWALLRVGGKGGGWQGKQEAGWESEIAPRRELGASGIQMQVAQVSFCSSWRALGTYMHLLDI